MMMLTVMVTMMLLFALCLLQIPFVIALRFIFVQLVLSGPFVPRCDIDDDDDGYGVTLFYVLQFPFVIALGIFRVKLVLSAALYSTHAPISNMPSSDLVMVKTSSLSSKARCVCIEISICPYMFDRGPKNTPIACCLLHILLNFRHVCRKGST